MVSTALPILLVEDDELDRELIARTLQGAARCYELTVARDGRAALDLLRPHNGSRPYFPALILLDLKLPRMDGLEFLRALRLDPVLRACIVFVLTNSAADADKLAAYQYCAAGCILKSDLASNTGKLLDLLEAYCEVVEFPPLALPRLEAARKG
jgi:CheY-like chemotaxis protein